MSESKTRQVESAGPGNRMMAAALLETLTLRGRLVDRERAARAAGPEGSLLVDARTWLDADVMARMLAAASIEASVARALGHRLLCPESMARPLYALGLATPEKAYRRIQSLLPREAAEARWRVEEIKGQAAWLSYRPQARASVASGAIATPVVESAACALRLGMLEAVPTLYGLLPAIVHDEQCVARGDHVCRYRVSWQRATHRGLAIGVGIGATLGTSLVAAAWSMGAAGLVGASAFVSSVALVGCAAAIGRAVDLAAQLDAVAGARRGQLALFEQIDDQLSAKLDALARVDAKLDAETLPCSGGGVRAGGGRRQVSGSDSICSANAEDSEPNERERSVLDSAQAIYVAAGDLERVFDAEAQIVRQELGMSTRVSDERARLREIRDWAIRIVDEISPVAGIRRSVDLASLVARAIASVRPIWPRDVVLRLEADEDLEPLSCEPVRIEQLVIQLVRNAIEASAAIVDPPEAIISVRNLGVGIEIAVEDRGAGIDSSVVDEVFDPFFGNSPASIPGGFGLPFCLRIAKAHDGELRIEAEDRPGTRVSVFLPHAGSRTADSPDPSRPG